VTRVLAALCAAGCVTGAATLELVTRDVYLMGTRARLAVYAVSSQAGASTLADALEILERTERQLTTWNRDSEISRLNGTPVGNPWRAPSDLCSLFQELYDWRSATDGAFDPGVGALAAAWNIHGTGTIPSRSELEHARRDTGLVRIDFNRERCTLTRRAEVRIDVGGFGKGEALDRVAHRFPSTPWMIDLGGQVSVGGPHPSGTGWTVDIAHPSDRERPVMQVTLRSGSLATSGSSERDQELNGARIGHILDPRTGAPAAYQGSVVVWHERGLVADVLSTALYVMGPETGFHWAAARGLAVCYLMDSATGVRALMTDAFAAMAVPSP
jgi:thiamine biosynthesis lipoprotein